MNKIHLEESEARLFIGYIIMDAPIILEVLDKTINDFKVFQEKANNDAIRTYISRLEEMKREAKIMVSRSKKLQLKKEYDENFEEEVVQMMNTMNLHYLDASMITIAFSLISMFKNPP